MPAGRPPPGGLAGAPWSRARIDLAIRGVTTREAPAITEISVRVNDAVAELIFGRTHVHKVIEGTPVFTWGGTFIFPKGIRLPSSSARHEIPDAVLGQEPCVQVLMGLEDDIHAMFAEDRLEFGL